MNKVGYSAIPLFVGACLLLFLLLELIRRKPQASQHRIRPSGSMLKLEGEEMMSPMSSTVAPLFARARVPGQGQGPLEALTLRGQQLRWGRTGDPYQDTQHLLSPNTLVCLKNDQFGYMTEDKGHLSTETLSDLDSFGATKYQWFVEHSPFLCRDHKAAIRLRHRSTGKYMGWDLARNLYTLFPHDDHGRHSSFLALSADQVSIFGDPAAVCLFEVTATEGLGHKLTEDSPLLLQAVPEKKQNKQQNKNKNKKNSFKYLQRPWQWTVLVVGPAVLSSTWSKPKPSLSSQSPPSPSAYTSSPFSPSSPSSPYSPSSPSSPSSLSQQISSLPSSSFESSLPTFMQDQQASLGWSKEDEEFAQSVLSLVCNESQDAQDPLQQQAQEQEQEQDRASITQEESHVDLQQWGAWSAFQPKSLDSEDKTWWTWQPLGFKEERIKEEKFAWELFEQACIKMEKGLCGKGLFFQAYDCKKDCTDHSLEETAPVESVVTSTNQEKQTKREQDIQLETSRLLRQSKIFRWKVKKKRQQERRDAWEKYYQKVGPEVARARKVCAYEVRSSFAKIRRRDSHGRFVTC